jgi:hypothetical protein
MIRSSLLSSIFRITLLIAIITTTNSCTSSKSLYQTFFVGDDGIQYFVKPLSFSNATTKEEILIDFTFRHRKEIKDSVTINFDLFTPNTKSDVDKIEIKNSIITASDDKVNLLYKERAKKKYKVRYSSGTLLKDVVKVFEKNDWEISLHTGDQKIVYLPTKKTQKRIEKIYREIFSIL